MSEKQNDHKKSLILAQLVGWEIDSDGRFYPPADVFGGRNYWGPCRDLYLPVHMALAWMIINWAMSEETGAMTHGIAKMAYPVTWSGLMMLPPEIAQRLWLDRILQLAIAANFIADEGLTNDK
jgi:hypothetical protein